MFAEALAEGAVKMGMPSALAQRFAAQTILVSILTAVYSMLKSLVFLIIRLSNRTAMVLTGCRLFIARWREASSTVKGRSVYSRRDHGVRTSCIGKRRAQGSRHGGRGGSHTKSKRTRAQLKKKKKKQDCL